MYLLLGWTGVGGISHESPGGRFRRIIIPVWTRSRSIENVADARLENILAGVAGNPAPTFSDGPPSNNYPPGADLLQHCKMDIAILFLCPSQYPASDGYSFLVGPSGHVGAWRGLPNVIRLEPSVRYVPNRAKAGPDRNEYPSEASLAGYSYKTA